MKFDPTPDQLHALDVMLTWWRQPTNPYLTLGGYAGTGKTSLLSVFRQLLFKLDSTKRVSFCAYTGKASQVLENSLGQHHAKFKNDSVSTIHSLIYAPIIDEKGGVLGWKLKSNLKTDLIIVDEASMIDRQIWEDLLRFGLPILAVGDHGQLPPIRPGFNLMSRLDIKLETIHRQAADNPIIKLSMMARETGKVPVGNFGSGVRKLDRYDSASGSEVEEYMQSKLHDLLVLSGFNHSRIRLNQQIRTYLGFESPEPQSGDRIICLKNNWEKGIYNGMTGKITRLLDGDERIFNAEVKMENGLELQSRMLREQFNAITTLSEKIHKKDNIELFDFGYALTVHKAQGSQAKKVLLFEERNKHMSDEDWRRWLYTGITRAEEELLLVGSN